MSEGWIRLSPHYDVAVTLSTSRGEAYSKWAYMVAMITYGFVEQIDFNVRR